MAKKINANRKYAIYSRKSKFTGKGESIANQIEICRNRLKQNYPEITDDDIEIYEDEGFSGKNTKRPNLQKMLQRCKEGMIQCVISYRLDRISRNVSDFVKLLEELDTYNVIFITANDTFDMSTSSGKAMMMIASVFAEMERNIIAERIRDNMHELAKSGRWLGGTTPTGFRSTETVGSYTYDGKVRKARKLEIIPEEADLVRLIFRQFLEFRSLTKLETYLLQNNIRSKNQKSFTRCTLKNILQNPVYMIADETAWNYFKMLDAEIFAEKSQFDGKHGMMVYNKTDEQREGHHENNEVKDWIIAVGKHQGLIASQDWIEAQKIFEQNRSKSYRKPRSHVALLSGKLYCACCGSFMRPKLSQRTNQNGERIYDYLCELKEKSRRHNCDMKRANGNELDKLVCEEIKKLSEDQTGFLKRLKQERKTLMTTDAHYLEELQKLRDTHASYETEIKNLVKALSTAEGTDAHGYILQEINAIASKSASIQEQIQEYEELAKTESLSEQEFTSLAELLTSFAASFDTMSLDMKRTAIRTFIHKIVWDGENAHIYFFGSEDEEIDLSGISELEPQRLGCK